jgi:hypothetical protein
MSSNKSTINETSKTATSDINEKIRWTIISWRSSSLNEYEQFKSKEWIYVKSICI